MYLTREQERMINGEYGWVTARALKVIVKVGEALGAEKLIPISHAHVSGISYSNIGDPGLLFIKELYEKGGRSRVYTTVNPGCIDLLGYSRIISREYYDKQLVINKFLEGMGFKPTYTCIPYFHRIPGVNEHLAWGESNAVIIANSFYGARTNREGGPLALAAAITGYTYYAGLHLLNNRVAEKKIVLPKHLPEDYYGASGLWIGENIREIPILENAPTNIYDLKILMAAAAASGSHGLIVIDGLTPKGTYKISDRVEKIFVEKTSLEKYLGEEPSCDQRILGYVGCPHLHPSELFWLVRYLLKKSSPRRDNVLLVSIPRIYAETYRDLLELLRLRGVDVAVGTCPIVSRLKNGFDLVVTNSGKAAFYLRRLHGLKVRLSSFKKVVEAVYS